MRILSFTTLFPNRQRPGHGIFVKTRLQHLLDYASELQAQVIAPVPWYPRNLPGPQRYRDFARTPAMERIDGLQVRHPRYLVLPKIGMRMAPAALARAGLGAALAVRDDGFDFQLLDAHYFYPDGVAAVNMARRLGVPVTITARGSDINLLANFPGPRRDIVASATAADHIFTVSAALAAKLRELGAPADKITVARNGVDLELFRPPADRQQLRRVRGVTTPLLLSVGNLIELKGHHLAIEALQSLPGHHLWIIGDGPELSALEKLAHRLQVDDRVDFLGRVTQTRLVELYGAADALLLCSSREGWANVLLEAMACGTPVVATDVSGNPEVVTDPAAGQLVERTAASIAQGVRNLLDSNPDRAGTRAYAERFSWQQSSELQLQVFRRLVAQPG